MKKSILVLALLVVSLVSFSQELLPLSKACISKEYAMNYYKNSGMKKIIDNGMFIYIDYSSYNIVSFNITENKDNKELGIKFSYALRIKDYTEYLIFKVNNTENLDVYNTKSDADWLFVDSKGNTFSFNNSENIVNIFCK